jgi:23S rRNA (adenine2503-C2)-methyltransferase
MASSPAQLLDDAVARLQEARASGELHFAANERIDLKNFTRDQLETLFVEGYGEKSFRADQLWEWLYRHLAASFDEMTNLSKSLRKTLADTARISPVEHQGVHGSDDGTAKFTFKCEADRAVVESVYIPFATHVALCISSQVGCAMGCTFCYTAKMGLVRNLTTAEIVDQVVQARRMAAENDTLITNIVFMGMGEPLHNYDHVLQATKILIDQDGLDFSKRRVTVSTSGLVPQMKRFMEESDAQIAVSLNATTDVVRSRIMPVNDRWDLDELMETLRELPLARRQRITIEYVLLGGVNDTLEDADRLAELVEGLPCKVNIIPFNPHPETPFETPDEQAIDAFRDRLVERHVSVFRRQTRGRDEMAACGQLGEPGNRKEPAHLRKRLKVLREELA